MLDLIGKAQAAVTSRDFVPIYPIEGNKDLMVIIANAVNAVLLLAGAIAVIYLIYGGILYITAGGDAEKATKGRTALINAIIGIIIILLALVIVVYIKSVVK